MGLTTLILSLIFLRKTVTLMGVMHSFRMYRLLAVDPIIMDHQVDLLGLRDLKDLKGHQAFRLFPLNILTDPQLLNLNRR